MVKRVLIVGLGKSGVATAETLNTLGYEIHVYDRKPYDQLEGIDVLKKLSVKWVVDDPKDYVKNIDIIVISPGVPLDQEFIIEAQNRGIEVISEVEAAYRLAKAPIIAVTGTNGKTTTTSLTGELFKNAGYKTRVCGNIGKPLIYDCYEAGKDEVIVAEISSFQLESIKYFRPHIAAMLNITPDHLDRHKTMENYIYTKSKIFINQDRSDYAILNYDEPNTWGLHKEINSQIIPFSRKEKLNYGLYIDDEKIIAKIRDREEKIMNVNDIYIPGKHNLENSLAACAIAKAWGIDDEIIEYTLKTFKGVEHRIEFVKEINGVKFINDSKGTNPDAAIKAIEAIKGNIILIAGGYDKGNDYYDFIKSFDDKVKYMILIGETAEKINKQAMSLGFTNIIRADTLKEAVDRAYQLAEKGDTVLLSPACASWDMFKNFEERGNLFKSYVNALRG
ncbi:MAG: UDP-N-acetylmuramoyl-L-alanine--D-glutamate ligase [Thermoanaerobacteraceae bacterium]|nr:UDP-N-acetylmuramoyl-L-alanine--D-glutamate ligase [Thermoanaerobacteraceae bacterium]